MFAFSSVASPLCHLIFSRLEVGNRFLFNGHFVYSSFIAKPVPTLYLFLQRHIDSSNEQQILTTLSDLHGRCKGITPEEAKGKFVGVSFFVV